ncbi:hypothetical protein FISHEDRAFT_66406 [Fistulina hepatica ATCC 64428]|uniref:Uncharacterized protein n=1 Tax=Fistulina hepatica ATCC 64428 TaxID=1128425 RepID=A0A0D7A6K2_9AGAR|nr:hypothetical protein FISHEDRAFT_66406 [Fistulina hepatica ATCC 64428]
MINNAYVVKVLGERLDESTGSKPPCRRAVRPTFCLPARLPPSAVLRREADQMLEIIKLRKLRRSPTPPTSSDTSSECSVEEEHPSERERQRTLSTSSQSPRSATAALRSVGRALAWSGQDRKSQTTAFREPEPYEVLRAVERKDLMYLMQVRDHAFHLLLVKSGGVTPLLHSMRIGQSHREVTIVLIGAFSRWINHLDDVEIVKPRTRQLMKGLRTNLKLAIDYGLARSQSDLVASFLQTLIMSEGDKWTRATVASVAIALRAGTEGKPVQTASSAVRKFATRELGKAELIATLEDYISNATADLLMMAAWSNALDQIEDAPIPPYYFARDDRVYKAFVEKLDKFKVEIQKKLNKRLRWQMRVLRAVMDGRTNSNHRKVDLLTGEFDEGDGV